MARDRRAPLQFLRPPPRRGLFALRPEPAPLLARTLTLLIWVGSLLLVFAFACAMVGNLAAALAAAPAARPVDCKVCSAGSLFLWGERQLLSRGRRGVSARVCAAHADQWAKLRAVLRRKAVSA